MRALVALLVVLAGCSQAPAHVPEGPEQALYTEGPKSAYLLGEPGPGPYDADVLVGVCGVRDNVRAYNISAQQDVRLVSAEDVPDVRSFVVATFQRTPDGLVPLQVFQGGSDLVLASAHERFLPGWSTRMPADLQLDSAGGRLLVLIACEGEGAVNYVVDGHPKEKPEAPRYVEPVVASGFDNMLGAVSEQLFLSPAPAWQRLQSRMGPVLTTYGQIAPDGLRVGETVMEWKAVGPGWSMVRCGHGFGFSEHGTWKYDGNMHGGDEHRDGFLMWDIATLYLSQMLLFGDIGLTHMAEGQEDGSFRFEVEHDASLQWSETSCDGLHVGAPLEELFGESGAAVFIDRPGFVRPSTIGGWPLDD